MGGYARDGTIDIKAERNQRRFIDEVEIALLSVL
jgi:hypothetical protein